MGSQLKTLALAGLAAVTLAAGLATMKPELAAAATFPEHVMERALCGEGGTDGDRNNDMLEPYLPIIYAIDYRPGVPEKQIVAWHVRLNRWTGSAWIVDPENGGWTGWRSYEAIDKDHSARYIGGAYSVPSGIRIKVPRLGSFYRLSFQASWQDPRTGSWTNGPIKWVGVHYNLVGGMYIPDSNLGFRGCDYVPKVGSVPLP
jgi:hypothetical protein